MNKTMEETQKEAIKEVRETARQATEETTQQNNQSQGLSATICIKFDTKFIDFCMKDLGITEADELKGYLKGLWDSQLNSIGELKELIKITVEIEEEK